MVTTPDAQSAAPPWAAAYADGVPLNIDVPDGTLIDMFDKAVAGHGSRVALEFFGAEISYAELGRQVARAAAGLRRLGVNPGDRVAILLPNCPQHVIAFYAVLRIGAIVVEQNPLYTAEELHTSFADHGAVVAIAWESICDTVHEATVGSALTHIVSVSLIDALPTVKRLALSLPFGTLKKQRAKLGIAPMVATVSWKSMVRVPASAAAASRWAQAQAGDTAVIQYTSGTSGIPKGVMLTHRNLLANARQGRAWVPGLTEGGEVIYGVLPLFHVYGLTLCLTFTFLIGAKLVLFPTFDVELVLAAMKKSPATFLPAVPPVYEQLARTAEHRGIDMTSIQFSFSGAMELDQRIIERWERVTGGYLVEGYGMTEAAPIIAGNPISAGRRAKSVGVPFPSTQIRIVNLDDPFSECAFGERGEIVVSGPQVFAGYWNNPDETAATMLPGGWLRTGDIGVMTADGYITIVDRLKELIVTGGFNVSPSEVEVAMRAFPGIAEVSVVGLPRRTGGEDVAAAVVMKPGFAFDSGAIRTYLREKLVAYKVPKKILEVSELPRSMVGKVLRRYVRENFFASNRVERG